MTGKVLAAAQALGREIVVLEVKPDANFTEAFATIVSDRPAHSSSVISQASPTHAIAE